MATYYQGAVLPSTTDLILLISGSYIVMLFAAFVHFIKETFTKQAERDYIARQKAETDLKLNEARLKLLQGQLHPHFLFNMLNNLYGLWMEKSDATPEVIIKLSKLLDYMLYQCNTDKVLLKDEIEFIHNYIDLEMIRHDARLKLSVNIDQLEEDIWIAPLILFVFVENAFKHGVQQNVGLSKVQVNLRKSEMGIYFEVINNCKPPQVEVCGIGLQNVKERLNLIYCNKHNLDIRIENGYFIVKLNINID
jgi:LytS/YehU family sensor histidine kinase